MDHEREWRGRQIGEEIDAFDRALRRARLRHQVLETAVAAVVLALLGGVLGLVLGGVDAMVKMAAVFFGGGLLISAITVGYRIYANLDDRSKEDW